LSSIIDSIIFYSCHPLSVSPSFLVLSTSFLLLIPSPSAPLAFFPFLLCYNPFSCSVYEAVKWIFWNSVPTYTAVCKSIIRFNRLMLFTETTAGNYMTYKYIFLGKMNIFF
jgi:hypothetical protein